MNQVWRTFRPLRAEGGAAWPARGRELVNEAVQEMEEAGEVPATTRDGADADDEEEGDEKGKSAVAKKKVAKSRSTLQGARILRGNGGG